MSKTNRYTALTDDELSAVLKEYSDKRDGEIAGLTYAASLRIAVLSAKVKILEQQEDDGK